MSFKSSLAPKVLLLTHGDPNANGVAEIYLREIATYYPPGRLFRYSLVNAPAQDASVTWLGFNSIARHVQFSALPILSSWRQMVFNRLQAKEIAGEIERFITENDIDIVWTILNSGYTIYLTKYLMQQLSIPFVLTVWDTPEHFAKNQNWDVFTKRAMLRTYTHVLQRGNNVAVVCEGMRDLFRSNYGVESIVMRHGIHPDSWSKPSLELKSERKYTIGFAGSLHCKREWNAFVRAIRNLERVEGLNIRIRFIGRYPRFGVRRESFIDFTGVLAFQDTLTALSQVDVAYVPFWFDRKQSYLTRTAFPSKISAYVAAGIPILYHGPEDSSPSHFMEKYPIGLCCHSLDIKEIEETLRSLLFDLDVRKRAGVGCQRALEEELGLETMLHRFALLLGIDRNMLLALDHTPYRD